MTLSREQILQAQDIATKEIKVDEWGDSVFIRQLTRGEQDEYARRKFSNAKMRTDKKGSTEITGANVSGHDSFIFICGVCDEDGKRLFKEVDIEKIREKNGQIIERLSKEILIFSGIEVPDSKDERQGDEEIKN